MFLQKISLACLLCISINPITASAQTTNKLEPTGTVGVGTLTPAATFHVNATQGTRQAAFTYSNIPYADGNLRFENATSSQTLYIPTIVGRAKADGRAFGLYIIGDAEDVAPSPTEPYVAAVMLDGRSKTATKLLNNNVLAINSAGSNLMMVKGDGSVGIGTTDTEGYKLAVNGSAIFTKVKVKVYTAWPDYVFSDDYNLQPLPQLEQYIQTNKHLPEMPTAEEVEKEGQDLAEINRKLLQKVEELTLYIIEQNKKNEQLEKRVAALEKKQ